MSFLTIAVFLENEAKKNESLRRLAKTAAQAIELNEALKRSEQALCQEHCFLTMELFSLETLNKQLKGGIKVHNAKNLEIQGVCSNFKQICEQLDRIDFRQLVKSEMQSQQMILQNEALSCDATMKRKKELMEQMENRNIVQQLRVEQQKYSAALVEFDKSQRFCAMSEADVKRKLYEAMDRRNEVMVNLIKGMKEIEKLEFELSHLKSMEEEKLAFEQIRDELKKTWRTMNEKKLFNMYSGEVAASNQECKRKLTNNVNPLNTFELFMSWENDVKNLPILSDFLNNLQVEKQLEKEKNQEHNTLSVDCQDEIPLRSILRTINSNNQSTNNINDNLKSTVQNLKIEKRVHFVESGKNNDYLSTVLPELLTIHDGDISSSSTDAALSLISHATDFSTSSSHDSTCMESTNKHIAQKINTQLQDTDSNPEMMKNKVTILENIVISTATKDMPQVMNQGAMLSDAQVIAQQEESDTIGNQSPCNEFEFKIPLSFNSTTGTSEGYFDSDNFEFSASSAEGSENFDNRNQTTTTKNMMDFGKDFESFVLMNMPNIPDDGGQSSQFNFDPGMEKNDLFDNEDKFEFSDNEFSSAPDCSENFL